MALHDTDKGNDQRHLPTPNANDKSNQRPAHGTISSNYTTDASDATSQNPLLLGLLRPVKTGTITVTTDGSTTNTATLAHGLGYKPFMLAAVENATATIAGGTATGVGLFLPTFLTADLTHANDIQFGLWIYAFCNSTNIYVNLLNTASITGSSTVTYYLFQQSPDR